MGQRFTVDVDQLEQVATLLSAFAGFIEANLDEFDTRMSAVLGASWEGIAARAFDDAQRQWGATARTFVADIRSAGDTVQQARDRYVRAAELNRQMS
ncbi:WXG100 family type VII secretion target [Nocardia harenae]|uniref:WXG100 family type VII secretion target n=1 Tax=Nocardia harenae TaxID=358707 RepID=UPI00082E6AFB|nr:WXG100 family type VII secretion target [Nocardia harenae]